MRSLQVLLGFLRAARAALAWGAGLVAGPLLYRRPLSARPAIAFQVYAEHLLYFYQLLIRKLLLDNRVDVVLLTWSHPQFPWSTQARLRELAMRELGLCSDQVVPFWRACWGRFDLSVTNDALALPLMRRTRTCQMFHGPILPERFLRRRPFRRAAGEYDIVLAPCPLDHDAILSHRDTRRDKARLYATCGPQFDKYLHPDRSRGEYLLSLGLNESLPVVVYAPHWSELNLPRGRGASLLHGVVRQLRKLPVQIIIKLHAMSMVPGVTRGHDWDEEIRATESARVRVDRTVEDVDAMRAADVLVTGVSSRAFNVMLLDTPVVLYPRARDGEGAGGLFVEDLYRHAAAAAATLEELGARVQEALANPRARSEHRRAIAGMLFPGVGTATEEVAGLLYRELGLPQMEPTLQTRRSRD